MPLLVHTSAQFKHSWQRQGAPDVKPGAWRHCCRATRASVASASGLASADSLDRVSNVFVDTAFRSTPWAQEARESGSARTAARVLFVSESGVCRSVLAQALLCRTLAARGLGDQVECEARSTRDYNAGEPPDLAVLAAAGEAGLAIPPDTQARQFAPETDIVRADLVLVMDKYTAADVLREVSVFDTINAAGGYSRKVRRLGEFHPELARLRAPDAQDIDDPLYGNAGGAGEEAAVRDTLRTLSAACEGLADFLEGLRGAAPPGAPLRGAVSVAVQGMESIEWLVPPMLQARQPK
ncbi:hypothetical protein WJX81_007742 [Elliptochloris bilobata]|uniref:protein-tyrosine-phosphatase n=1 Tax=Elliptochloris bilobata TaxID=381761 RepID=A0AAW1SDJ3_9CHLO